MMKIWPRRRCSGTSDGDNAGVGGLVTAKMLK